MKKIYSLLAAACVGVSAMAVNPAQFALKNVSLNREKAEALANVKLTPASLNKDNGVDRMMKIQDANGNEWSELISVVGPVSDIFTSGSIEEFPFYIVRVQNQDLSTAMGSGSETFVCLMLTWPTKSGLDTSLYTQTDQGAVFDAEAARAKYGDAAFEPMTYDEVFEATGGLFNTYPGLYYNASIIGCEAAGNQFGDVFYGENVYKGAPAYPIAGAADAEGRLNFANATNWTWEMFDPATSDVKTDLQYKYSSTSAGAAAGNLAGQFGVQLSGSAIVLGFSDILWDNIGQVHIFNGGRQNYGDEWTWNFAEAYTGVLNFYYIAMCDDCLSYTAQNTETGEVVTAYTDKDLPVFHSSNRVITGGTDYWVEGDYHPIWVAGAIWAPENVEFPYGMWSMKEPVYNDATKQYDQTASAWNLLYRDNSACGDQQGFYIMYEGYVMAGMPEASFIGIGDKKLGVNFRMGTAMSGSYAFVGSTTKKIFYHATPNKWTEYEEVDATTENGNYDTITSSVEAVESDAPVVSTTYYNFQGQRLSSEPENGMYIVRAVKADGTVKATKVAK